MSSEPFLSPSRRFLWAGLAVASAVYAASFFLPALTMGGFTEMSGGEAFLWSFQVLALLPGSLLYAVILTPTNVLFLFSLRLIAIRHPTGFRLSILTLVLMILSGMIAPDHPSRDFIQTPGGHLGLGYYLWTTAGAINLVLASVIRLMRPYMEPLEAEAPRTEGQD